MKDVNVRLTHVSRAKEYAGGPGDVVQVPEDVAERWAAANGCVILDEDTKPAKKSPVATAANEGGDAGDDSSEANKKTANKKTANK